MLRMNLLRNIVATCTKKRRIWQWLDNTFNRIDHDRIKTIGPNMACAEWLMKNGAQVRLKGCKEFVSHYDCLPKDTWRGSLKHFKVEQVLAGKDATISHIGFGHFKDCKNISDIAFVECQSINDKALDELKVVKDSLSRLRINGCVNVSDIGILNSLRHLQALRHLNLKNLTLNNETETVNRLITLLPNCYIVYGTNHVNDDYKRNG